MKNVILIAAVSSALVVLGCEKAPDKPKESAKPAASNAPPAAKATDNHDHKPGETHADGHSADDGHDHGKGGHGAEHELGTVEIAGLSVKVVYHGAIAAGKEADFDVHIAQGSEKVTAARLWVGTPDGKGAMKAKATINKDEAHNHVEVPNPLPPNAAVCVELELTGGQKQVGTLPLPK